MIAIHECRITDDGKYLIIDASVLNNSYYKNVYIESVIIDTDKTYQEGGYSYNPIYEKSFQGGPHKITTAGCGCNQITTDTNCECGDVYTDNNYGIKTIRLVLDKNDLPGADLNENIFFVYIKATGYPEPGTPCGMDNEVTLGIAYNLRPLYNQAMGYIKEIGNSCDIPRGFIDMILRLKALELAFKTGHYKVAIEHWYNLFKNKKTVSRGRRCGCNGSS